MKKEQLILLLKNYRENKAKLNLKQRQKERIKEQLENLKDISLFAKNYEANREIHSKNKISDVVGKEASKQIELEQNLKIELEEIEEKIKELEFKLEEVEIRMEALKRKEKEILMAYYVDGYTYEEIGEIVFFKLFGQKRTARNIQEIVNKTIEKMLNI